MNQNALYYPYIHIEDVNWLKATLLLFSQVRRMLPANFAPEDSDEVRAFARETMGRPALLFPANLWTPRAIVAQEELAKRLLIDAQSKEFRRKYGKAETRKMLPKGDLGFQIHFRKLAQPLCEALLSTGLAWTPINQEPYEYGGEYVELHPHIGEAVMGTLAVAAATGEGLDVVGDRRSGRLHECLLQRKANEIYDAWLHPTPLPAPPSEPTGEEVFEFLVGFSCDLSAVTPDTLATLQANREPLHNLADELRAMASMIPAMDPGREREERFHDATSAILQRWQADRANMTAYWREFFGQGLVDTSEGPLKKIAESLVSAGETAAKSTVTAAGGGAAAVAAGGGGAAAVTSAAITGAGAGLVIGVIFHGVRSYMRMRKREQDSPYRYLTHMEKAGVVFRSDIGSAPQRGFQERPSPATSFKSKLASP